VATKTPLGLVKQGSGIGSVNQKKIAGGGETREHEDSQKETISKEPKKT